MSSKQYLLLRFEAPMQSWGRQSHWDLRGTDALPTKSAVIGLIGSAMGLKRGDERLVQMGHALKMGVRVDRAGQRFVDYQTVTGEPLLTAEGKPRSLGNTIITPRQYLEDASFTVVLTGHDQLVADAAEALRAPHWPLYLGRRCCVPTRPVLLDVTDEYDCIDDALASYPFAERHDPPETMLIETESSEGGERTTLRSDALVDAKRRLYGMRQVKRKGGADNAYDAT